MNSKMTVCEEQLQIVVGETNDLGYMPVTISSQNDPKAINGLTILLKSEGASYLAMESVGYLIDAKAVSELIVLRDLLFSLPLESGEKVSQ